MSVFDKLTTRYAHGFKSPRGNIGYFPSLPVHETAEDAHGCPSIELVSMLTGMQDGGLIPLSVLKNDPNARLHYGVPINIPNPFGTFYVTSGPIFDEAIRQMKERGEKIPDHKSEAYAQAAIDIFTADDLKTAVPPSPPLH